MKLNELLEKIEHNTSLTISGLMNQTTGSVNYADVEDLKSDRDYYLYDYEVKYITTYDWCEGIFIEAIEVELQDKIRRIDEIAKAHANDYIRVGERVIKGRDLKEQDVPYDQFEVVEDDADYYDYILEER